MPTQVKIMLTSVITSTLLGLSGVVAGIGISHEQWATFVSGVTPVIISLLFAAAMAAFKAIPLSKPTLLKAAAELPDVSRIVTTNKLADTLSSTHPEVVSFNVAARTPPSPPAVKG